MISLCSTVPQHSQSHYIHGMLLYRCTAIEREADASIWLALFHCMIKKGIVALCCIHKGAFIHVQGKMVFSMAGDRGDLGVPPHMPPHTIHKTCPWQASKAGIHRSRTALSPQGCHPRSVKCNARVAESTAGVASAWMQLLGPTTNA